MYINQTQSVFPEIQMRGSALWHVHVHTHGMLLQLVQVSSQAHVCNPPLSLCLEAATAENALAGEESVNF